VEAIRQLIDAGTNQMHNLQLVLLKGSELEKLDTRKEFSFETRFRVLPKNFGIYGDEKVLDIEEIVVSTDTMSFEDYITSRKIHLISSVFWNDSWFENAVAFAQKFGVKRSQWFEAMLPALEASSGPAKDFLDRFVREATNELFPSREECEAFYKKDENFARLLAGDIGDNLMYKYRAMASFLIWKDLCKVALDATRRMIEQRGGASQIENFDEFWEDFARFVEAQHASGATEKEILEPAMVTLRYDIGAWIAGGMNLDVSPYRLTVPAEFEFHLTETGQREMAAALAVWTCSLKGLTKMVTRIQMAWQVRQPRRLGHVMAPLPLAAAAAASGGLLPEQW
jgi:hypothetical protein